MDATSLRDRKKARTRAALIEVSQRLFADQGYAETTLDDICREVEITPQTLLRYFPSKAHLAVAVLDDALEELRAFLEHPDRVHTTLLVWTEYLTLEVRELDEPSSSATANHIRNLRAFHRWTTKDPVLIAMHGDVERRLAELLAASLERDWDAAPGDLHAALVASALVAGRRAVWMRWLAGDDETSAGMLDEHLAVVGYVKSRMARSTADRLPPPRSTS